MPYAATAMTGATAARIRAKASSRPSTALSASAPLPATPRNSVSAAPCSRESRRSRNIGASRAVSAWVSTG